MTARFEETYNLLIEWGVWSRGAMGLHYRSPLGIIREMNLGTTIRSAQITDEAAERVDLMVAKLRKRNNDLYEAMRLTFVCGVSQRQMAKEMQLANHLHARDLIQQGVACIDILLHEIGQAA